MKQYSEKFKKQRKFLLVLPLLVLPFITMAFWALDGGKARQDIPENQQQKGFNTELPEAQLSDGAMDKMSLYHIAEQDSQALHEATMQDPYAGYLDTSTNHHEKNADTPGYEPYDPPFNDVYAGSAGLQEARDPNEQRVQRKLSQLEDALNATPDTDLFSTTYMPQPPEAEDTDVTERLEQVMNNMQQSDGDPELQQLDGMLEKILDIQHPGRVQKQLKEQSEKEAGRVFPVTTTGNTESASLLERPYIAPLPDDSNLPFVSNLQQNAFYDLTETAIREGISHQAIPAVIHETQTLVSGTTVKLRLTRDVYVNGMLVPKNTFVFGTCEVSGERLNIQIMDIRYGSHIFPVSLSVYDLDGIKGIKVPGAITRNAAKQSSGQALQSMQLMSLEPSLGAQAAGAGIEAVKGLLSRKAKLVRVTVKAGYPVLLVDKKSLQQ